MQNEKKDRGMIKWQPFASLPEHMEQLNKIVTKKKISKKKISSDKLNEMNRIVEKSMINSTKIVLILYKNNEFTQKIGIPLYFDNENKMLIIMNHNSKKERNKIIDIVDVMEN